MESGNCIVLAQQCPKNNFFTYLSLRQNPFTHPNVEIHNLIVESNGVTVERSSNCRGLTVMEEISNNSCDQRCFSHRWVTEQHQLVSTIHVFEIAIWLLAGTALFNFHHREFVSDVLLFKSNWETFLIEAFLDDFQTISKVLLNEAMKIFWERFYTKCVTETTDAYCRRRTKSEGHKVD